MNDTTMENFLRMAPAPTPPTGLRERLIDGIRLNVTKARRAEIGAVSSNFRLRRWLAPLSYAALTMACAAVIAVQTHQLAAIESDNEKLRALTANLPILREANAEEQRLRMANEELDRLRQDNADIPRLRDEIAQLRAQLGDLADLRVENQRLKAANKSSAAPPDFFAAAQDRAERIACVNNLKQIGTATRIWANDHHGQYPPDFISMTNALYSWKVLLCPGDKARQINSWADVAGGNVSYQIDATGLTDNDNPNIVVYECPLHHNFCMLDGSVQQLSEVGISRCITNDSEGRKIFTPLSR